jgi:hypothetical protein
VRRLVIVFLVAAVGSLPFVQAGSGVLAQGASEVDTSQFAGCAVGREPTDSESEQLIEIEVFDYLAWEGVCEPMPNGEPIVPPEALPQVGDLEEPQAEELLAAFKDEVAQNPEFAFQPYAVPFMKDFAATLPIRDKQEIGETSSDEERETREAEFMVVVVVQGRFVLDVLPDDENADKQIVVTMATDPETGSPTRDRFQLTEAWDEGAPQPHYVVIDDENVYLVDGNGDRCTRACVVEPGRPVLLEAGDYAIAERGVICRYCLERSFMGENGEPDPNGVEGLLEVYALLNPDDPEAFSWIQSWRSINASSQQFAEPPTRFAWAFPNLSTGCRDR